jgi:hypothetical protein
VVAGDNGQVLRPGAGQQPTRATVRLGSQPGLPMAARSGTATTSAPTGSLRRPPAGSVRTGCPAAKGWTRSGGRTVATSSPAAPTPTTSRATVGPT